MAGLEPAISCSRSRRISHLSHTPRKCPAGVEPARSPWQGDRLPLHHGHCDRRRIVKENQSTGWGSNPRHRLTRAVSCLLDHQCKPRVGPEGLEPSPAWLRARCAAANTLVPPIARSRPGRSRTSIFRLSAERSAAELQAVIDDCRAALRLSLTDGAGGTRTPTPRLKRPMCCRYTTTPHHSHSHPHSVPLWGHSSTTGRIRTRETAVLETARAPSRSGRVCPWR